MACEIDNNEKWLFLDIKIKEDENFQNVICNFAHVINYHSANYDEKKNEKVWFMWNMNVYVLCLSDGYFFYLYEQLKIKWKKSRTPSFDRKFILFLLSFKVLHWEIYFLYVAHTKAFEKHNNISAQLNIVS